jgi:hypothetical protein
MVRARLSSKFKRCLEEKQMKQQQIEEGEEEIPLGLSELQF